MHCVTAHLNCTTFAGLSFEAEGMFSRLDATKGGLICKLFFIQLPFNNF